MAPGPGARPGPGRAQGAVHIPASGRTGGHLPALPPGPHGPSGASASSARSPAQTAGGAGGRQGQRLMRAIHTNHVSLGIPPAFFISRVWGGQPSHPPGGREGQK